MKYCFRLMTHFSLRLHRNINSNSVCAGMTPVCCHHFRVTFLDYIYISTSGSRSNSPGTYPHTLDFLFFHACIYTCCRKTLGWWPRELEEGLKVTSFIEKAINYSSVSLWVTLRDLWTEMESVNDKFLWLESREPPTTEMLVSLECTWQVWSVIDFS